VYRFQLKTLQGKVIVGRDPRNGEEITTPLLLGMDDVPEDRIRDEAFHYRSYLMDLLQRAPVGDNGMDILQMRKQWKLLQRLRKAENGDTVTFENAEWDTIKGIWEKSRWNLVMETLMELDDDITSCKEEEPSAKSAEKPEPLAEKTPSSN